MNHLHHLASLALLLFALSAGALHAEPFAENRNPRKTPATENRNSATEDRAHDPFAGGSGDKSTPSHFASVDPEGVLTLAPQGLMHAIAHLEDQLPLIEAHREGDFTMPNVLFDKSAEQVYLPTKLQLRHSSALQMLTLITAASECRLEPIVAHFDQTNSPRGAGRTDFEFEGQQAPIVGYRVVKGVRNSNDTAGAGINPSNKLIEINNPKPSSSEASEKIGHVLREEDPKRESVVMYPVAFLFEGLNEEEFDQKIEDFVNLASAAMAQIGHHWGSLSEFKLHEGTRVIIVKAIPEQHQVIEQTIDALRKNHADTK